MRARKKSTVEPITTVAARQNFSDLISRVAYGKERILLTCRNRPLAAVVPIEDIALLEEIEDRDDLKDARAAIREVKRKGTIKWALIKKELGLKLTPRWPTLSSSHRSPSRRRESSAVGRGPS